MLTKRQEYARAWPVVIASALGAGTGVYPLIFYSLGAFVGPLTVQFGWTRTQITAAPLFFTLASLLVGSLVGGLADRHGARRIAIASQLLLILGLCGMSLIGPAIWTLYAGYVGLAVLGAGTMTMTWARAITGWFVTGRGFALGLSLVGTGLIGAALPSYVTALIVHGGWRAGFYGLAMLPLVLGLPITVWCFREPEESRVDGPAPGVPTGGHGFREAIATRCFWHMTAAFFLAAVAIGAVIVNVIPMLSDRGVDRTTAAALASLIGIAVTVGRLVSGYLLDLVPARRVAFTMFALPAIACGLLLFAGSSLVLNGIAIAFVGLAGGAEHDIAGYFTANHFGRRHYGAIYGLLYTIYCVGSGVGPILMGFATDRFGSGAPALIAAMAIFLVAACLIGTLRPPPSRSDRVAGTPEEEHYDAIIVGAGLGGLSAGLRAAEGGLRVLLLEAGDTIGGTAYFSGGGVHIWGAQTWDDYRRRTPLSDPRLTRTLFDHFLPYVRWLESTGAPGAYSRTMIRGLGLLRYQLGRTMAPWARRRWLDHIAARIEARGGTIRTATRVSSLLLADGRVTGVVAGAGCIFHAPTVVLAAGGFQSSAALLAEHIGADAGAFVQRAVSTDVGDGLRMASAAGAATTDAMDSVYGHLMPAAPCRIDWGDPMAPITLSAFYAQHGIVVNRAGQRFVDEAAGELDGTTINAAARQPPGLWVILDEALRRGAARYEVPTELLRPSSLRYWRLWRHARIGFIGGRPALFLDSVGQAEAAGATILRAGSLRTLAQALTREGVDGVALLATLERYDEAVRSDRAHQLPIPRSGKPVPIATPPYLAIKVGVGVSMTYGGVCIDDAARALDRAGTPVPGLYAVPGTAGGIHSLHYAGALAACGVFGMLAADAILAARIEGRARSAS